MTAQDRRKVVAAKYATLIGRNIYSQTLRDYCFRQYKDGNYYSDCSSSICYTYKEVGEGFGILNTAGIYQYSKLTTVDVPINAGVPDSAGLRVGGHAGVRRNGRFQAPENRPCRDVLQY